MRRCENFLYVFKGARSAPGRGWPPIMEAQRAEPADRSTASNRPPPGHRHWGTVTRRAPPADLRPSGPRRRRRALSPRGRPYGHPAVEASGGAPAAQGGHPSGARS